MIAGLPKQGYPASLTILNVERGDVTLNKSLVFQGKSVDSAIQLALDELQLNKEDVKIEVLDPGTDRLFGLRKSKVKIQVSKRETDTPEINSLNWEEWLKNEIKDKNTINNNTEIPSSLSSKKIAGKAWIKDGELYFQDTDTKKPIIEPTDKITVKKNNTVIHEKTYLTRGDSISFELITETIETTWAIRVDKNKQTVSLSVEPGYYLIPFIPDHPPSEKITLQINKKKQPNNQLTEKDVIEQLNKMKITHGINLANIKQACLASDPETFIIAEGRLPKHGNNGDVKFTIDINEKKLQFSEGPDGTIDFRESMYIPSIEEGELLGTIKDPTDGEDGITVYGEIMEAHAGKPIILKMGSGITFIENENKLIATEQGRPKVDKIGQLVRLSVFPKLYHRGDLNLEDGNIHFVGDVEITGHVNEQMTVDVEGSAFIHKNVIHSSIQTRNNITIAGNAINSSLIAGKNSLIFEEMIAQLQPFIEQFQPFLQMLKQLVQSQQFQDSVQSKNGLGPVIQVLMESKYKTFSKTCGSMIELINAKQNLLDRRWKTFAVKIYKGLLVFHSNEFQSFSDIKEFYDEAIGLLEICQSPSNTTSMVKLLYTMNSDIHCNGDVHIIGKGCIHSTIHADGEVMIKGKVLGGHIASKAGIEIDEAGSESGVKTLLEVPENQVIEIKKAHTDVTLKIGRRQFIIKQEQSNIRAYLNEDNQIILY